MINPNLVTFAVTIINVAVLFFLLKLLLFKPVSKFMAERTKKIEDSINQSEKDKNQAKQLLEQYELQLKNAEAEAEEIIRQARDAAKAEARRIIDEGVKSIELMRASAARQAEQEHEAALAKFRTEAVLLVMAASTRLLGRELQTDDSRRYVNILIDELSRQYNGLQGSAKKGNI